MAVNLMFSLNIVGSDDFLEMPPGAQNLYFHLNMRADDDGFVNNPRIVTRIAGATEPDLRCLADKGYILSFDNGVVAITHWRVHNQLRKDRYKPTRYQEQFSSLSMTPSGAYTVRPDPEETPFPFPAEDWQPVFENVATQIRKE